MQKYDVHVFAIARVKVCGVEANSQAEACKEAEGMLDLHALLDDDSPGMGVEHIEWAEEIDEFYVDEVGDEEYDKSRHWTYEQIEAALHGCDASPDEKLLTDKELLKLVVDRVDELGNLDPVRDEEIIEEIRKVVE